MSKDSDEPTPGGIAESTGSGEREAVTHHGPRIPGPLIFGVIAGTIEFAVVLWLLYC